MLKKVLKGLGWALLGLLLAVAVLWTAGRVWPVPSAQREALQRLQVRETGGTHDGFAQLWTLRRDGLDAAGRQQLLAEDVRRWAASTPGQPGSYVPAGAEYPELALAAGRCGERGEGCLAQVRADPQAVAAAHAGHQALHARIAALATAQDFSSPFVSTAEKPFPPSPGLVALTDPLSAWALAHVQGDSTQALAGLCSGIASGRTLMLRGDDLMIGAIGAMQVELNTRVLAEVLVELPADQVLPAPCDAALALLTLQQVSMCRPMQGEFAMATTVLAQSVASTPWSGLLLDVERTRLRMAPYYQTPCDPGNEVLWREDRPLAQPPPAARGIACLGNYLGCSVADMSRAAMAAQAGRGQDAAALLRLLATQRWLRQQSLPVAQALQQLPAALVAPGRPVMLSADGHYLQVPRRHRFTAGDEPELLRVPLQAEEQR